jgi:hypothetical protein
MQLRLKVDVGEGPEVFTTNLWVITQWERKFKTKLSQIANGFGAEDMGYMAYECSKAAGKVVPAMFDDYLRKVVEIEMVDEEHANPTGGAPTVEP